ncbi:MAG: hypothetical protein Roseis2KO_35100 [Roseivirga sp.]
MAVVFATSVELKAQHSIAREWNEMLLTSIRNDFARPTVHARNLFHISAAMYDAWSVFNPDKANAYLLGNSLNGFNSSFAGFTQSGSVEDQTEEAISYAAYRMLLARFAFSPNSQALLAQITTFMEGLGYDASFTSTDFSTGSAAALGNYIALQYLDYGLIDGSQEEFDYANLYYQPVNEALEPAKPGNPNITDLNRWQPLSLDSFIDQSGNVILTAPKFLSPEWGNVFGFSLTDADLTTNTRDGNEYRVFNDPGMPPLIEEEVSSGENDYHWGFELVSIWGAHLDPADGVMWDISPASIGNMSELPTDFAGHRNFYKEFDGGDASAGRTMNPKTGQPYAANMVPRGDYARVLAEFWADGPDSETPPGHWFTLLNYVSDHDDLVKKFRGQGETLSDLEWDIKSYFILGGAMHDAAISAWSIKGWYDYLRPVSAIRAMADLGQRSDVNLPNYHENGITLKQGYIEMVEAGDDLAGANDEHVGKVKLYTWKGPDFIDDPETDVAGVGWILAENWWPYQRPTFVTPPFAGYVSGHSTYSRAAAEVLTLLTGDEYFPGGIGEFVAPKDEFLVFEDGPSVDVTLQWATYRDASDQTSLSRIWGGIHPPADDIPGRIIGEKIGVQAFEFAEDYFNTGPVTGIDEPQEFEGLSFGPNPVKPGEAVVITIPVVRGELSLSINDPAGMVLSQQAVVPINNQVRLSTKGLKPGLYIIQLRDSEQAGSIKLLVQE